MNNKFNLEKLTNKWVSNNDLKENVEIIQNLLNSHDYCTPKEEDVFNAFKLFPLQDTKVIILGQDPYPNSRAHGFAFSFQDDKEKAKYSLKNIFSAVDEYLRKEKCNIKPHKSNLKNWAKSNNVLLLNAALTYKDRKSQSEHYNIWNPLITNVIYKILSCETEKPLVIFLWGTGAQKTFNKCLSSYSVNCRDYNFSNISTITRKVLVLQCSHPKAREKDNTFKIQAPLQFALCNKFLGKDKINWADI